jgi:hypothetical protein
MYISMPSSSATKPQTEAEHVAGANRILSNEEHQIHTLPKTDVHLDVSDEEVVRTLETLGNKQRSSFRVTIAPHKKLPFEIMGHVFSHCGPSSSEHNQIMLPPKVSEPWCNFAHVCSQWRKIALSTPGLWSRLHIRYEDDEMEGRVAPMVREILSRTRSVPLCLAFTGPDWSDDKDYFEVNPLGLIMSLADRLQSLSLALPYASPAIFQFLLLPPDLFGIMERFNLSAIVEDEEVDDSLLDSYKNIKSTVFDAAASLRSIELNTPQGDDITFQLPLQLPWAQLTDLRLKGATLLGKAHAILSQCRLLVHCQLVIVRDGTDPEAHNFSGNLFLPELHTLKLYYEDVAGEDVGESLRPLITPSLVNLGLWICGVRFPPNYPEQGVTALLERSSCQLQSFRTTFHILESQLGHFLTFMPNLSKLRLSLDSHIQAVPGDVLEKLARGELLPRLKVLKCTVHAPSLFVDMLEARSLLYSENANVDTQEPRGVIQRIYGALGGSHSADELSLAKERLSRLSLDTTLDYRLEY